MAGQVFPDLQFRLPHIPFISNFLPSGSFLEFLPILSLFRDEYKPSNLPYHLVIPSLPGYTFSSGPPLDRDFGVKDVGRIMNELMTQLGFSAGYVAQGGDIGSRVARILAAEYESCKGLSLYSGLTIFQHLTHDVLILAHLAAHSEVALFPGNYIGH